MKIVAICPTYRRKHLIPNVLAMWESQDYQGDRHLIICEDGGEFIHLPYSVRSGENWTIHCLPERCKTLGSKFATTASMAIASGATHIVLFEDDDVYGPGYLSAHAQAFNRGEFSQPTWCYANDSVGRGKWHKTDAKGRHHGAWGFSVSLYSQVGGYNSQQNCGFDINLGNRMSSVSKTVPTWDEGDKCHYLYRWFTASKNGSAFGDRIVESQDQKASPWSIDNPIVPGFDAETLGYYREFWS